MKLSEMRRGHEVAAAVWKWAQFNMAVEYVPPAESFNQVIELGENE